MAPEDPKKRPEKRILLLSGPPGLGKTTLAHVIAKHAGYNLVEVNARYDFLLFRSFLHNYSDDRTSSALKSKVTAAIEAQMGKPNLVVIDEIDGASASGSGDNTFINLLFNWFKAIMLNARVKRRRKRRNFCVLLFASAMIRMPLSCALFYKSRIM